MRKYLIAGLLVWLPLAVTVWVLHSVLGLVDDVFGWLVAATQAVLPESLRAPLEAVRRVPGLQALSMTKATEARHRVP